MINKKIIFTVATVVTLGLLSKYQVVYEDDLNNSFKVEKLWVYEAPTFEEAENENYDFTGWKVKGSEDNRTVWHIGQTTLESTWKPKTFQLSYTLGEGESVSEEINSYTYNPDETISLPNGIKEHYVFEGWSINEGDPVKELEKGSNKDLTLSPVFTPETYKIIYNLEGGKAGKVAPESYEYGSEVKITNPMKAGYVFNGWLVDGDVKYSEFGWDRDVTLTATWKEAPKAAAVPNSSNYISVGGYSANLVWWGVQSDCDKAGTGVICELGGKILIGDHRFQGFSVIEGLPIGSQATVCINGNVRTLTLNSRYSGHNVGTHLTLSDGTHHGAVGDGDIIMYTCQAGSSGYNITLTYWS